MKILKLLLVAALFSFSVFMVQPTIAAETLNYSHGTYVGDTLNGKAHGFGTYTSKQSGTKYTGQFVADTFSGAGTMFWNSGAKYVGQWQNDSGVSGSITYPNGATAVGTVRNAVFQATSQQPVAQTAARPTQNWNFLDGICVAMTEKEYLKSCDIEAARRTNFPSGKAKPLVAYKVYRADAIIIVMVPSEQFKRDRPNLDLGLVDNVRSSSSVRYQQGSEPNSVLATETWMKCTFTELYRKNGSVITQENLSMTGQCDEAQRMANAAIRKDGPKPLHIIR